MHKPKLIDHVSSTTMIGSSRTAPVDQGPVISLLGRAQHARKSRAARHDRNRREGACIASRGVRFAPGSPCAAARSAKSGARKAASAKAAKAPAVTVESVRLRERRG